MATTKKVAPMKKIAPKKKITPKKKVPVPLKMRPKMRDALKKKAPLPQQIKQFKPRGKFPFAKLPFELQREIFQYLLVVGRGQVLRPEDTHGTDNDDCFQWQRVFPANPCLLPVDPPCVHRTISTQLLTISRDVSSVAVQVLYGCNQFHFSSAGLFNKFTETISPLGVQSLRYLAIDYPTFRSFQVASLRRIVIGREILDMQVLELNMRNEVKHHYNHQHVSAPSAAAERFMDLLEGLKETESVGNNEILFTIKENFDVNICEVREKLMEVARQVDDNENNLRERGYHKTVETHCTVKLTKRSR